MEILDYITIAVFAAGIMFVGSLFSSTGKNMKSFFAGGGNVPWWISGLSLFMGFFSAGTFVVWGSIAYSMGFVAVTIQLTMAAAGFAVGLLIAPRWNKTGCLTAAEYITRRYGASTQKLYTYIFLFISIFTTGSFLYPIAKIIEVAAGIPLSSSILILGVFCMIYVSLGGLRAVVVTDVLQFIILFAAVIIVIPLAFGEVGGVPEFLARVPEGFFTLFAGEYNWVFIVAFMLYNLFFLGGNWAYVQRYTSVRTPRDAKKVGVLFGVLYTFSPILWMLPPMIYRVFEPGLSGLENENAYLLMCKQKMPAGMLGLMLGGMIFATASSLNATLNISAGVFTNDIFKRLRPAAGETTLMKVARISTLGFGVLAIAVALGVTPLYLSIPVVILAAFFLLRMASHPHWNSDAAIAAVSASALAIGILVISRTTGMTTDVDNYMFGSVLAMTWADVALSAVLSLAVLALFVLFYHKLFAVTFDESFSRATGLRVDWYNTLLAILTALTIVLGMRMMGAMLISSLVIFPALTAMRLFKSFRGVVVCAAVTSVCCFCAGLMASWTLSTPVGASVVAANLALFLLSCAAGWLRRR